MKRLALIVLAACGLVLAQPQPARADYVYFLWETTISPYPYAHYIIGGPYADLQTCNYVKNSYPFQSGILHSCEPKFIP